MRGVAVGFFEVPRDVARRAALREQIPVDMPDSPVMGQVDELFAQADELTTTDERLIGIHRLGSLLVNRGHALQAVTAATLDARGTSRVNGLGTTGTMIASLIGHSPAIAAGIVAQGRALRSMPATAAAYQRGQLTSRHVSLLAEASTKVDGFTDGEAVLVAAAVTMEPKGIAVVLDTLIGANDPEHLDDRHDRLVGKRGLTLSEQDNGLFHIRGHLDPIAGRRLADLLVAYTDRAEHRDTRSISQRRADALDMIVAKAAASRSQLGVNGLTLLAVIDQLADAAGVTLEDGTPIGPDLFHTLTCTPILTVILGRYRADTFIPLAMGRTTRYATDAQRAALAARDRGCIHCGRPPAHCEAHHLTRWADGGLTDLNAQCLFCPGCHHDYHRGYLDIIWENGRPKAIPTTKPQRRRKR